MVEVANDVLEEAGLGDERRGVATFEELEAQLRHVQEHTRQALEGVLGVKVE